MQMDDESQLIVLWPLFRRRYFRCIFVNGKFHILIKISLKFLPKGSIDSNPPLVQIGDKPLSKPMLTRFIDVYMRHQW